MKRSLHFCVIVGTLAVASTLAMLPVAEATIINGDCEAGVTYVAATGSDGTGNSSTVLTGWTYKLSNTPYTNYYIGKNVSTWNQRPGSTGTAVGSVFHGSPTGKSAEVYQLVTGLTPGASYSVSAWFLPVLVAGKPSGAVLTLGLQDPTTTVTTWGDNYGDAEAEKGVWANAVMTQVADGDGEIKIRINMALGAGGWTAKSTPMAAFDDVTVTLLPEPATLLFLVLGSVVMLKKRR